MYLTELNKLDLLTNSVMDSVKYSLNKSAQGLLSGELKTSLELEYNLKYRSLCNSILKDPNENYERTMENIRVIRNEVDKEVSDIETIVLNLKNIKEEVREYIYNVERAAGKDFGIKGYEYMQDAVYTDKNTGEKYISTHDMASDIAEILEEYIEKNGVYFIPDMERSGEDGEATLYGQTYARIVDEVEESLQNYFNEKIAKKNNNKAEKENDDCEDEKEI